MSSVADLAQAVTDDLNATSILGAVVAEMQFLPLFELQDMLTLRVTVVPRGVKQARRNRSEIGRQIQIDIGVQQKIQTHTDAAPLLDLVEAIADHFTGRRLPNFTRAICKTVDNDPVYAPDHLDQLRQFTSVLTLNFEVDP